MHKTFHRRERRTCRAPWSSLHREKRPWLSTFVSPRILASQPPAKYALRCLALDVGRSTFSSQSPDWPSFWQRIQPELRKAHFQTGTLKVYRQVLRQFFVFVKKPPSQTAATDVNDCIYHLCDPSRSSSSTPHQPPNTSSSSTSHHPPSTSLPASSHWLSVNISILRTVLDKLGGLSVTEGIRTPKRPSRIPLRNTSAPFSLPESSARQTT